MNSGTVTAAVPESLDDFESKFTDPPDPSPLDITVCTDLSSVELSADIVIGDIVGVGGMGTVYSAQEHALRRQVAAKMTSRTEGRPGSTEDLVREAQILAQLEHPHIVPVHSLGRKEGRVYMAMPLANGSTLGQIVTRACLEKRHRTRAYMFDILDVLLRVCDALAYAHARGVVHCDVKPSNILVAQFGCTYLIDWGIARLRREWGKNLPFSGTPDFCAPEQRDSGRVDPRTDVYAIGAVLAHAFKTSLASESSGESSTSGAPELEPFLLAEPLGFHASVSRVVRRCLAPSPDDRYASVEQVRADLQACSRGEYELPAQRYVAGDTIVEQGEICEADSACAYLIESGTCVVFRNSQKVRTLGPGDVFGESSVLLLLEQRGGKSPGPVARTATVKADADLVLRKVDSIHFSEALHGMKYGLDRFMVTLAKRFVETQQPALVESRSNDNLDFLNAPI